MKFNPNQTEIRCKKSSLAIQICVDDKLELQFYVFNRRTRSIIAQYKIPLMEHCRRSMMDIAPIPIKRKKKHDK